MKSLRYLLIIPSAIVGWFAAFFISLQLEHVRTVVFCPENLRDGTNCYAAGWEMLPIWLIAAGTALSAVFVVFCSAITAPANKLLIAIYTYFAGIVLATVILVITGYFLLPYLAAAIAGWIAVLIVARFTRTSFATALPLLRRFKTEH
jgi:hypothetical protein